MDPQSRSQSSQAGLPRLPVLDGLRLLAALGVVFFHVRPLRESVAMFERTYLLVDFFFLLSGFVLTLAIEPRLRGALGTLTFVRQRFVRFWPIAAIGTALGMLAFASQDALAEVAIFVPFALLMIPLPTAPGLSVFPLNIPQWSLFWELVANALHALVLHKLDDKRLLVLAAVCACLLAVTSVQHGTADLGSTYETWWAGSLRIGWSYTLGCWIARRYRRGHTATSVPWWLAMGLPVMATCALPLLPLGQGLGDTLVIVLIFPPCLWIAARARCPTRYHRPLALSGSLSFPLYATHMPVILGLRFQDDTLATGIASVPVALLVAFAIARLTDRRLRPRRSAPAPASDHPVAGAGQGTR